jgi:hypothetical protein
MADAIARGRNRARRARISLRRLHLKVLAPEVARPCSAGCFFSIGAPFDLSGGRATYSNKASP